MVRCSIKRLIKTLAFSVISIVIFKYLFPSSYQNGVKEVHFKEKSPIIFVVASYHSKNVQRLILFLNELRLSSIEYSRLDRNFYDDVINHRPSMIIIDHVPNINFQNFVTRNQISSLVFINNKCQNCISIKYSEMLFENVSYRTIDFNRDQLKPVIHTTSSPFKIEQSNDIIKLLRFDRFLPYFFDYVEPSTRCLGLSTGKDNSRNTIIYVQNKLTLEKVNLITLSIDKQVHVSECLYRHWFIWPLIMDILRCLTSDLYNYHGLNRYIQVDIDDIFLGGKSSDRLKSDDIQALIRSQSFIQNYLLNFRYRLGFSGYYFNSSNDEGNQGDRLLISKHSLFFNNFL